MVLTKYDSIEKAGKSIFGYISAFYTEKPHKTGIFTGLSLSCGYMDNTINTREIVNIYPRKTNYITKNITMVN